MTEPLGIGIVGCGEIATETAVGIAASPLTRTVIAMDTSAALAEDLGTRHGAPWTTDLEQVLAHPAVDAVYIAVPHDLHCPLTLRALTAGKHVLVEKPIATTLADADRMIAAAGAAGRVFSVAFTAQTDAAMAAVKHLVDAGAIGRIVSTRAVKRLEKPAFYWTEGYEHRSRDDWRTSLARAGGGVLLMNAIHDLNTIRYVTGLEVTRIAAEFGTFTSPAEVEDFAAATYRYSTGAIGTVEAASDMPGRDPGHEAARIHGDRGQILLATTPQLYLREAFGDISPGAWAPVPTPTAGTAAARLRPLVDGFARACLDGTPPAVSGEDGRAVLEIVLAAYRSGRTHASVSLPLDREEAPP